MRKFYFFISALLFSASAYSQSFTSATLPGTFNSGNCTGVVDMNNDGLDDIVILDQSSDLKVAYQQTDGDFTLVSFGTVSNDEQWGMCVADMDNDGHKDVLCGGHYDNVHLININGPGDYEQIDFTWASIYMQGCSFGDIDNDGWLDAFACHDDGHSAIFHNDGAGQFVNGAGMLDLVFAPEVNGNDNAGNYGSVFCDFDRDGDIDLMIAKCRQFINDPLDPRRTNVLLVNDGNGNYTNQAQARGLVNLQQSWTAEFADYDNDGDFDCFITTHSGTLELYENDGNGYFTEVTEEAGLAYSGFFLEAKFADFDNDGFLDVLHSGGSHRYFHNNGNGTFTLINNMFPNNDTMHSFGIGDLNHDGWLDLYASYGNSYVTPDNSHPDKLFINNGGTNNYIVIDLEGTISNRGAVGAVVEITGAWGTQIRDVRAGEAYGITNTSLCHFGLGDATSVDMVKIYWPSGIENTIFNPAINQYHTVVEASCLLPVSTIEAQGNTQLCAGGSVTLSVVEASGDYEWSNGSEASSITVSEAGVYSISVSNEEGCSGTSNAIVVSIAKPMIATIIVGGETEFCEGGNVTLTANNGASYEWSNGEISQQIVVEESGDYEVEVTGPCSSAISSTIAIEVHDAPEAPVAEDETFIAPGTATLTATGNNTRWYDSALSTEPIYEGASYTTPVLNETTSYWVEDMLTYGGVDGQGGKTDSTMAEGVYQSNPTYFLKFDAHEDVYIRSVKIYSNTTSDRNIEVVDAEGATVVSGVIPVVVGEQIIELNFFVPAGNGYGLRCTNSNPRMWRDKNLNGDNPYGYPFNLNGLVSITGTNITNDTELNYYYFFYDWNVESPSWECVSDRTEVQAIAEEEISVSDNNATASVLIYPNPTEGTVNLRLESMKGGMAQVRILDQMGKLVSNTGWSFATGRSNTSIAINQLASGIYTVEIVSEEKTIVERLIVK